jgi:hypothetical protein
MKPGKYRHYKGQYYEVLSLARHSETSEQFVVYKTLYDDSGLWIRPLAMFDESITVDGKRIKRFQAITD